MKRFLFFLSFALCLSSIAAKVKSYTLASPNGKIVATINVGDEISYSVDYNAKPLLLNSPIAILRTDNVVWGRGCSLPDVKRSSRDYLVASPFTHQSSMRDHFNELAMKYKEGFSIVFRAYDEGVAYRFVVDSDKSFDIKNEVVEYNFAKDYTLSTPYVLDFDSTRPEMQFINSFENIYTTLPVSQLDSRRLSFLPIAGYADEGVRFAISESHLENYPGMYLVNNGKGLHAVFAQYPNATHQGGYRNLQLEIDSRLDCIARIYGKRTLPWRMLMIADSDKHLAENNMSYLLGAPCRVDNIDWIKPGKVAWDWWNDWNIEQVDFRAGINNDTYIHYIDFAADYGIEYVILDEGWTVLNTADLMQVVPEIDIKMLVDYAAKKGVGIILWAGFYAFERDMEHVCQHYAEMGVKGFKIDFMDRDDQLMADFYYRAAACCAKYHLLVDFHGAFKPAGLSRTYPNVLNFEGVSGLEQMKWCGKDRDQVLYDVQLPFIRQLSGPMDYTQGAMRNATRRNYYPCFTEPMSQGTRCHQLGMYMVFSSPLCMLCDSPTNYRREEACTRFIASIPTVWDETVVLQGTIGEYVVTARRKGDVWYIGGINNWQPRDIDVQLSSLNLNNKDCSIVLFTDGINADRRASDFSQIKMSGDTSLVVNIHMAPGGGFAMRLE